MIDGASRELLVGEDPRDPRRLWRLLRRHSGWSGNGGIVSFANSALDIALWDVAGRVAGQPVHRLLGGKLHDRVRTGSSVILNTLDLDALARGVPRLPRAGVHGDEGRLGHRPRGGVRHRSGARPRDRARRSGKPSAPMSRSRSTSPRSPAGPRRTRPAWPSSCARSARRGSRTRCTTRTTRATGASAPRCRRRSPRASAAGRRATTAGSCAAAASTSC